MLGRAQIKYTALLGCVLCCVRAAGGPFEVRVERDVKVSMSDGVPLAADLYLPVGPPPPFPVVLIRTPYNKAREAPSASWFASHGYAVLVQDVRGKFASGGIFQLSANDTKDGAETVAWAASQAWSTGKVGTYGCSYLGEDQIEMSKLRVPEHRAMIAQAAGGAFRYADLMDGGVMKLSFAAGWMRGNGAKVPHSGGGEKLDQQRLSTLPSIDILKDSGPATDFESWISHEPGDAWWDHMGYVDGRHHFNVPALHIGSWMDSAGADSLELYNLFRRNSTTPEAAQNQFVIISPMAHCGSEQASEHSVVQGRNMGDARFDYKELYLRWFDRWLKGVRNGVESMPHVRVYVMGANRWRMAEEWPLAGTKYVKYFLKSGGHANSDSGDGTLTTRPGSPAGVDRLRYNPLDPFLVPGFPDRPASSAKRQDVLVYTSALLENSVEVTGPVEAQLFVSSNAKDTDFIALLRDVGPDGTAYPLCEGIMRMRWRAGFGRKVLLEPRKTYPVRLNMHATSNLFEKGHRIRLEISSSAFPEYERNLNTGGSNYDEARPVTAINSVHHTESAASYVLLPIVE
jgi:uncharacterized protein